MAIHFGGWRNGVWMAVVAATLLAGGRGAWGWSHQGHILLTRLACLRIINDPGAPAELRAFLQANMKYDLAACQRLAEGETAGAEAKDYLVGMDGASTWPDRVIGMEEGKAILAPYGAPESKMHFLDMEALAPEPTYKDDLSHKPQLAAFPRNVKDPRYAFGGYVPFRVDEMFHNLVGAFGGAGQPIKNTEALKWTGSLAHYLEDCTQPQHATVDYKSLSYLAGKIKAVRQGMSKSADGTETVSYYVSGTAKINPHGDMEFQLFENTAEPRKGLRAEYWKELTRDIQEAGKVAPGAEWEPFDGFTVGLVSLRHGYDNLPLIGRAALAAYAKGEFDAETFFTYRGKGADGEMTVLQMIARQNALAVVNVERAIRRAWAEAKKGAGDRGTTKPE